MVESYKMSKEEKIRLENLTPRPNGLTPGTMEYQEYFKPGTSSLTVLKIRAQNKKVLPKY